MKIAWAAVFALLASATWTFADDAVGKIESIAGTATAQNAAGQSRDLAQDAPVFLNDRIATGPGSKLSIRFIDNTSVGQGENAELVINRYVFDPNSKSKNEAGFSIIKGAFRFLTDQITKLNPEKFEVEGNYGTIGIRGCDLGFHVGGEKDEVLVIGLAGKESILFNLRDPKGQSLLVTEPGIAVSMSRLEITQRRFDPGELRELLNITTVVLNHDTGGGDNQDFGQGKKMHGPGAGPHQPQTGAGTPPGAPPATVNQVVDNTTFTQQNQNNPPLETPDGGMANPDGTTTPPPPDNGGTGNGGGGTGDGGGSTPPPTAQIISTGPKVNAASGSGVDWEWDIWSREIVYADSSGVPHKTTKFSTTTTSRPIGSSADGLINGTAMYNLNGSGPAGATVTWKDQSVLLLGTAGINVQVGNGNSAWSGSFGLQDSAGDALRFALSGTVDSQGTLVNAAGSPTTYTLDAMGFHADKPTTTEVGGSLVGSGTGRNPITGAIVTYSFTHGSGNPVVTGAGGADLH